MGVTQPSGPLLVVHDYMGESQLDELPWDHQPRGDLRSIGLMDGYRPTLAYRCLVPVRRLVYPTRYDGDERSVLAETPGQPIQWLGGFVRQPDSAGRRCVTLLTAPVCERAEGISVIEPILVPPEYWRTWLCPQFDGGPLQRSPTELGRSPPYL